MKIIYILAVLVAPISASAQQAIPVSPPLQTEAQIIAEKSRMENLSKQSRIAPAERRKNRATLPFFHY